MILFGFVRVLLAAFGVSGVLGLVLGVPMLLVDREWGKALNVALGGGVGVWLIRVAMYGTFSGMPAPGPRPAKDAA